MTKRQDWDYVSIFCIVLLSPIIALLVVTKWLLGEDITN